MSVQWNGIAAEQEDPFSWENLPTNGETFVHSAVDKTGEEQHLLLLYVENNQPELLQEGSGRCGQMYLETIVEENSDDLRSSEDDSLGWGSWEDSASDDDRLTVVEVQARGSKCEETIDKVSDLDEINEWLSSANDDDSSIRDSRVEERIADEKDNSVHTVLLATPTAGSKVEQWIDRWIDSVCQEIMVSRVNGCVENNMADIIDTSRCVVNTVKDVLGLAEPDDQFYLFNGLSTICSPTTQKKEDSDEVTPEKSEFWFNRSDLEAFWPKPKGENPLESSVWETADEVKCESGAAENLTGRPKNFGYLVDNCEHDWITGSEGPEESVSCAVSEECNINLETAKCAMETSDDKIANGAEQHQMECAQSDDCAQLNVLEVQIESENFIGNYESEKSDWIVKSIKVSENCSDDDTYWNRNLDFLKTASENYGSNLLSNWAMKAKFSEELTIFPDFEKYYSGDESEINVRCNTSSNSTNPFVDYYDVNERREESGDNKQLFESTNPFNNNPFNDIPGSPFRAEEKEANIEQHADQYLNETEIGTQKAEHFQSKQSRDHRLEKNGRGVDETGISGSVSEYLPSDDFTKTTEVLDDSGYVDETSSGSDDPPDRPPLPSAHLLAELVAPSVGKFQNQCDFVHGALNCTLPDPSAPLKTHKSTLTVTSPLTTDPFASSALGCVATSTPDICLVTSDTVSRLGLSRKQKAISTPDLTKVNPPFGALIGKSVNERIQDYLQRARSEMKSLPEREKVRHYQRLCSSNETVCQRAARFEAGAFVDTPASSIQTTPKEKLHSKPTAAVRPTIISKEMDKPVPGKPPIPSNVKSAVRLKLTNARKEFFGNFGSSKAPQPNPNPFEAFRAEAVKDRAKLASSTPDLSVYTTKAPVRTSHRSVTDAAASPNKPSATPYRRCTGDIVWTSYTDYLHQQQKRNPVIEQPNYLETDIDTLVSRTVCETSLDTTPKQKAISMLALDSPSPQPPMEDGTRARSMDFLLEDDNRAAVIAPENTLGGRVKSERELRFERSLQNLTLPDWYKDSEWSKKPKEGFILKRDTEKQGWKSSGSRTPSVTSLTSGTPRKFSTDWRNVASLRSSRESLPTGSSCSLSPREQGTFQYGMSRWSSSRLSTGSAPSSSTTQQSAWNRSFRQPYMGWRAAAAAAAQSPGSGSLSPAPQSPLYVSRYSPTSPRLFSDLGDRRPDSQASNDGFSSNLSDLGGYQSSHERPLAFCRDRYSYIQSVYNSELSWDLGQPEVMVTHHQSPSETSPQRSKMVWMESSFINDRSNRPQQAPDHRRMPPREPIVREVPRVIREVPIIKQVQVKEPPTEVRGTSLDDVLDSLLAIPMSSRSSSPTTPRRDASPLMGHLINPLAQAYAAAQNPQQEPQLLDFMERFSKAKPVPPSEDRKPPLRPRPTTFITSKEDASKDTSTNVPFMSIQDLTSSPTALRRDILGTGKSTQSQKEDIPPQQSQSEDQSEDGQGKNHAPSPAPNLPSQSPHPFPNTECCSIHSEEVLPKDNQVTHGSFCHSPFQKKMVDLESNPSNMEVLKTQDGYESSKGKSEDGEDDDEDEKVANPFDTMQDPNLQGTPKSMGTIKCQRPKCTKSLPVEEARSKFRTCSNCYTYYCSRHCRKLHWQRHQSVCPHTKISNLCKQVLMKVRDDPTSRRHLSTCARRGLLSRGRGAVKLMFPSPESALDYLCNGWDTVKAQTIYISRADLLPQEIGEDIFSQVRTLCEKYNPERKFVLLAAIVVTNELSSTPGMCLEREVIVRGTKLHLAAPLVEDDVPTLILTVIKDPNLKETTLEDRRSGLSAIEQQLMDRGVALAKQFPEVYSKLSRFAENNVSFAPVNIFPTDQRTKKLFMCIILPWADGDIILNISSKTSGGKPKKKH